MMLVVATFIITGAYVGYHYSQDADNFTPHEILVPAVAAFTGAYDWAPVSHHNAAGAHVAAII